MSSLYLNYFSLVTPPFSITPDPSFFFEGKDRGVFMAGLLHATMQAEGIVVVIGEVGSGKTLMSRILLTRLPNHVDTVYLPNPAFSRDEIIDVIARDLGIDGVVPNQGVRLAVLQQELIKRHVQGRQVIVLIDEAHAMPTDSIEEVRRLSNLETDNHKLVQIVLFGQPELDTLLEAPHLRQVRDRVVYRLVLRNLSKEDSRAYLDHRLRVAGWRGGRMFTWYAERLLLADAKGRARRMNLLADKALLAAYADNKKQVHAKHVRLAMKDAGLNFVASRNEPNRHWGVIAAWMASIVVTAVGSMWFAYPARDNHDVNVSSLPPAVSSANHPLSQKASAVAALPRTPELSPELSNVAATPTLVQPNEIKAAPTSELVPKDEIKIEDVSINVSMHESLGKRVKQSHAYAREQSAAGNYTIRLATLPLIDKAAAFIASTEKILPSEQIYVRRFSDGQQTSYIIYFGSFPTHDAAKLAIADLPERLHKDQPTIRTWKVICDAPWSL